MQFPNFRNGYENIRNKLSGRLTNANNGGELRQKINTAKDNFRTSRALLLNLGVTFITVSLQFAAVGKMQTFKKCIPPELGENQKTRSCEFSAFYKNNHFLECINYNDTLRQTYISYGKILYYMQYKKT